MLLEVLDILFVNTCFRGRSFHLLEDFASPLSDLLQGMLTLYTHCVRQIRSC